MKAGQYITDGTAIFILDDVRDGNRVGDIVLKPTLKDDYIKANGATVKASEYPRLLKFAQDNNLCVSDNAWSANSATKYVYDANTDTLKVPNAMGKVLQGEDALATKAPGLPNITGYSALNGYSQVDDKPQGAFSIQKYRKRDICLRLRMLHTTYFHYILMPLKVMLFMVRLILYSPLPVA